MDPAKREEMRKKMEGMTPEQRQEFMKKTREQKAAPGAKPDEASKGVAPAPAGAQSAAPPDSTADRDAFRKSLEGMTPEQRREAIKKRMESMTPEQREAWKKQRAERGGAAPQ
jgi:DNA-directed RNA polymerase specialized sigma24 family protein